MLLELCNTAKGGIEAVLSLFYPEVCQICGQSRATPPEGYVCAHCREQIKYIEPPLCERCGVPFEGEITTPFVCSFCSETKNYYSYARGVAAAEGVLLDIIHRYKYNRALWFEPFLVGLLVQAASPTLHLGNWDLVVPVPLHPLKQNEREFNQAERLARPLSEALGIPLETRSLRRVQPTRTQTKLSRGERAENVRRAFAVKDSSVFRGKRLVLVDDVRTTGATTNACARVLMEAGADEVCVWTVARGLLN